MPTKNFFTLKNINVEDLLSYHYGETLQTDNTQEDDIPQTIIDYGNDISIKTLMHEKGKKSRRSIIFLDPHKGKVKYWLNMIDIFFQKTLPLYTTKPCWNCRSTFKTHPIGCPLVYKKRDGKTDTDVNIIKKKFKELNLPLDQGTDYFETEGIFCTFPCVKEYILDELSRNNSAKYNRALTLLTLMTEKLTGEMVEIPVVGDRTWKLLESAGGHLTPKEYRSIPGILEYTQSVNTRRPYMFCSSSYIQEKMVKL